MMYKVGDLLLFKSAGATIIEMIVEIRCSENWEVMTKIMYSSIKVIKVGHYTNAIIKDNPYYKKLTELEQLFYET